MWCDHYWCCLPATVVRRSKIASLQQCPPLTAGHSFCMCDAGARWCSSITHGVYSTCCTKCHILWLSEPNYSLLIYMVIATKTRPSFLSCRLKQLRLQWRPMSVTVVRWMRMFPWLARLYLLMPRTSSTSKRCNSVAVWHCRGGIQFSLHNLVFNHRRKCFFN